VKKSKWFIAFFSMLVGINLIGLPVNVAAGNTLGWIGSLVGLVFGSIFVVMEIKK
jgi:hypothetical protein